jgi:cell division septation protein DedD
VAETPSAQAGISAPARDEAAKSPGAAAGGTSASAKSVSGDEGAGQTSGKPVRDVPNMRVLAPALVKPEPAESAPPPTSVPEPGNVPVLTAPAATQSASVPKTAPQKPATSSANAAGSGFLVQLASVNSEKLAEREWARLQKAFPDLFGDRELTIEKKDIAGRGTFYRVQTGGYASLDEARAVCGDLKAKKQACLPVNR